MARSVGKAFTDAFDVRLVEKTSARWGFWFGLLERYADDNGTARVPVDYVIGGYPLGQWASVQRGFYTKGTLSEDRQERLKSVPAGRGTSWLTSGACGWVSCTSSSLSIVIPNVPFPYMVGNYDLRSWVATQRGLYKRGELSEERVRELEELPGWVWDILEDNWTRHYEGLKKFAEREGHARTPQRYIEEGLKLGQWVVVQRRNRDEMTRKGGELCAAATGLVLGPVYRPLGEGVLSPGQVCGTGRQCSGS